jgi:hypothetical protein
MKKLINCLLAFVMIFTSACDAFKSTVKNEVFQGVANVGAPVIAKYADCAQEANINAFIYTKLDAKYGNKKSAGLICKVALEAVIPELVGQALNEIPADWECKLTKIEMAASDLAEEACQKLNKDS